MPDAVDVKRLERVFKFKKDGQTVTLSDPNPDMSLEEVQQFYGSRYPEITTATFDQPKVEGKKYVYNVKTTVGTKG